MKPSSSDCRPLQPTTSNLEDWIDQEISRDVHSTALEIGARLRTEFGDGVAAILFYGSCLRDADFAGRIADFYVLVDDYRAVHNSTVMAVLNRLFPPNVYSRTVELDGETVRAKVAVLSLKAFEAGGAPSAQLVSIWGRFCQPCRLVHARDDTVRRRVAGAITQAVRTFAARTAPLLPRDCPSEAFWTRGLAECYRTELRTERGGRAQTIYADNRAYFDALHARLDMPPSTGRLRARTGWFFRRLLGKTYSVVRLVKAAFTFDGGADYICWKIARHSGVRVTLSPWQRRHPILASTLLFWDLYRKGAFR